MRNFRYAGVISILAIIPGAFGILPAYFGVPQAADRPNPGALTIRQR